MSLHPEGARSQPRPEPDSRRHATLDPGLAELYPQDEPGLSVSSSNVDIVLVPALGAHPQDSWKHAKTGFNWASDKKDGLARDFPRARILLYTYGSSWTGRFNVANLMEKTAQTLLTGLKGKRKGVERRPIVFIGHSTGGLVIARALVMAADSQRDIYPLLYESITATIFFGTPWDGVSLASAAALYADFAEEIADGVSASKLLDHLQPGNDQLRDLKNDFLRLVAKLSPAISVRCFWEEQRTDWSDMADLPRLFQPTKLVIPDKYAIVVPRSSAALPGVQDQGLACNHCDLVTFESVKDPRYAQLVREPLKRLILAARQTAKARIHSTRGINPTTYTSVLNALDGAPACKQRDALTKTFVPSSWIPKEAEFTRWLTEVEGEESDLMWIRGPQGRGKTNAALAALDGVENYASSQQKAHPHQGPILVAYFFCDTAESSTAEDVVKSVLRQLIKQDESLLPHAKQLARKVKGDDSDRAKSTSTTTIENLWQALQGMLSDDHVSRFYFVVNNLHALPADSDSTIKLMMFLNAELLLVPSDENKRADTRWFITSRKSSNVTNALKGKARRLIDLADDKYSNQVQMDLRRHAKQQITKLQTEKQYSQALSYFASSLVGKRARNTQWIDLVCVELGELEAGEKDLKVRRTLEKMPQDVSSLLYEAWEHIFDMEHDEVERVKEMLRCLVLAFEDTSESELCLLMGLDTSEESKEELWKLIDLCRPLLLLKPDEKGTESIVCFVNPVVRTHLRENATRLLEMSDDEQQWQQGVIALRCFSHLKESFGFPSPEPRAGKVRENEHGEDGDEGEGEGEGTKIHEADKLVGIASPYAVKWFMRHASKSTVDIAEDLSLDGEFWEEKSAVRRRWLLAFNKLTGRLNEFSPSFRAWSGVHVASSVGYRQLVAALVENGHREDMTAFDSEQQIYTPLHLAASYGRLNTVEELLDRGAAIDSAAEKSGQTPLYMAAFGGHSAVMKKLLARGANPQASAIEIGPVLNAAIESGNRDCVGLLAEKGAPLTVDDSTLPQPLSLAAVYTDFTMFKYLVGKSADKIPADEFSKALVAAAWAGRADVLHRLLQFDHSQERFQEALATATRLANWDIVLTLMEKCPGLDCDETFHEAAISAEQQDKVLEALWEYAHGRISPETINRSLYDAADRGKFSTCGLLVGKFDADPNATGEEYGNALTAAAFDGTMDIVLLLLSAGADLNSTSGWALQAAATQGHDDIVSELLRWGADVNAWSNRFPSATALQGACESGQVHMVELLLERGARPELGAGLSSPPIIAAVIGGEAEIVDLLLKHKADVNVRGGWYSATPLIESSWYLPVSSTQLILDAGADINQADKSGHSALIWAALKGNVDVVKFLLRNGADILHTNNDNDNAIQMALQHGNHECVGILVDHMSAIMRGIKSAIDSGNREVLTAVQNVHHPGHVGFLFPNPNTEAPSVAPKEDEDDVDDPNDESRYSDEQPEDAGADEKTGHSDVEDDASDDYTSSEDTEVRELEFVRQFEEEKAQLSAQNSPQQARQAQGGGPEEKKSDEAEDDEESVSSQDSKALTMESETEESEQLEAEVPDMIEPEKSETNDTESSESTTDSEEPSPPEVQPEEKPAEPEVKKRETNRSLKADIVEIHCEPSVKVHDILAEELEVALSDRQLDSAHIFESRGLAKLMSAQQKPEWRQNARPIVKTASTSSVGSPVMTPAESGDDNKEPSVKKAALNQAAAPGRRPPPSLVLQKAQAPDSVQDSPSLSSAKWSMTPSFTGRLEEEKHPSRKTTPSPHPTPRPTPPLSSLPFQQPSANTSNHTSPRPQQAVLSDQYLEDRKQQQQNPQSSFLPSPGLYDGADYGDSDEGIPTPVDLINEQPPYSHSRPQSQHQQNLQQPQQQPQKSPLLSPQQFPPRPSTASSQEQQQQRQQQPQEQQEKPNQGLPGLPGLPMPRPRSQHQEQDQPQQKQQNRRVPSSSQQQQQQPRQQQQKQQKSRSQAGQPSRPKSSRRNEPEEVEEPPKPIQRASTFFGNLEKSWKELMRGGD